MEIVDMSLLNSWMHPDTENCDGTKIIIEPLTEFYRDHVPYCLYASGIHKAILEGDFPEVKRWIESGGCVSERIVKHGLSALHLAVIKNDLEVLEYLLTRDGIEVDCTCSQDRTPLQLAAALGHIKLVEKLIQAGSDVNIMHNDSSSALHLSVRHPDICHLLIRHGGLVDAVTGMGRTPLDIAVEYNCLEAIHMLLYYNADVNVVGTRVSPFGVAALYGIVDAQWALLDYVSNFDRISDDLIWLGSPLGFALHQNSPIVKDMIERGADVNYGDDPNICVERSMFSICLQLHTSIDLSIFKLIWERLQYNDTKNTIDFLDLLNRDSKVPTFLQVIIESDNFETAVECFCKGDTYFLFVNKFAEKNFEFDLLTALTCRLLEYGFRPSSYDIHAIFAHYGYCELFRILLYMDNDFIRGWLPHMTLTRLICDINYDLESDANHVNDIPKETVLPLLEYSVCPRLIDALTLQYSDDEDLSGILSNLPRVPLLIELAQNAARKQIWQSFQIRNTCQFYTTIDHLDIPTVYKDILTFKRKIYMAK